MLYFSSNNLLEYEKRGVVKCVCNGSRDWKIIMFYEYDWVLLIGRNVDWDKENSGVKWKRIFCW